MFKLYLEKAEANIHWREFQKKIYFCFIDCAKPLTVWITANWKILKEMGIPDYFTCLMRHLYAGKEQHLEPDMEQRTGSKLGKEYVKAVFCQPAYLTYMQNMSRLYFVNLLI